MEMLLSNDIQKKFIQMTLYFQKKKCNHVHY